MTAPEAPPSITVTNPATGEVVGKVTVTRPEEVAAVVEKSREVFAAWSLVDVIPRYCPAL